MTKVERAEPLFEGSWGRKLYLTTKGLRVPRRQRKRFQPHLPLGVAG